MREEKTSVSKKPSYKGRKTLVVFGLLFILAGVFIGSFACSFQVMIQAENSSKTDENSIEAENRKLKENVQLLQDQITILESELNRYNGTSASSQPTSTAKAAATAKTPTASASSSGSGSSSYDD